MLFPCCSRSYKNSLLILRLAGLNFQLPRSTISLRQPHAPTCFMTNNVTLIQSLLLLLTIVSVFCRYTLLPHTLIFRPSRISRRIASGWTETILLTFTTPLERPPDSRSQFHSHTHAQRRSSQDTPILRRSARLSSRLLLCIMAAWRIWCVEWRQTISLGCTQGRIFHSLLKQSSKCLSLCTVRKSLLRA